ncbi:uncharacterized protein LOC125722368 [Brienomyrus brachyistius]|uniref:uncharacterized protein LOC125722368 n=1 Tax=Brienomyrus brachyistius TaxID=42636 RepID=UPI0020B1F2B8|nr:uncharacterized protein LOC125722368 [Brienomyrus brachyistius]XP_048854478.1 uncharacterized protein LOC125722368 [Brienomyrus brachyistius]
MDEFDYSVHISELDWDSFFHECEECDLLSPAMASSEASGASDADDVDSGPSDGDTDVDCTIDGPPDCEGLLVENYISMGDPRDPEDLLSSSEEDRPLEAVNRFFERLRSLADPEECLTCRPAAEATGSGQKLAGFIEKYHDHVAPKGPWKSETDTNQSTESNKTFSENTSSADGESDLEARASESVSFPVELLINGKKVLMRETRNKLPKSNKVTEYVNVPTEGQSFNSMPATHLCLESQEKTSPREQDVKDTQLSTECPSLSSPNSEEGQWHIAMDASSLQSENKNTEIVGNTTSKHTDCDISISCAGINSTNREPGIIVSSDCVASPIHENSVPELPLTEDKSVYHSQIHPVFQNNIQDSEEERNRPDLQMHPWEDNRINNETEQDEVLQDKLEINTLKKCNATESREAVTVINPEEFSCLEKGRESPKVHKTHYLLMNTQDTCKFDKGGLISRTFYSDQNNLKIIQNTEYPSSQNGTYGVKLRKDSLSASKQTQVHVDQKKTENEQNLQIYSQDMNPSTVGGDCTAAEQESPPSNYDVKIKCDIGIHHRDDIESLQMSTDYNVPVSENTSPLISNRFFPESGGQLNFPQTESKQSTDTQTDAETTESSNICKSDLSTSPRESLDNIKVSEIKNVPCALLDPYGSITIQTHTHEIIALTDDSELSNEICKHNPVCAGSDSHTSSGDLKKTLDEKSVPYVLPDTKNSKYVQMNTNEHIALSDMSEFSTESSNHIQAHTYKGICLTDNSELNTDSSPEVQFSETEAEPGPIIHEQGESTHPVYAISSFWDEMEKLTINDILQLRLVSNAQHSSISSHMRGSTVMKAVDSGIFTQPGDYKPESSSGDISSISDMEEELPLTHNVRGTPSPALRDFVDQSQNTQGVLWDSEPEPISIRSDVGLEDEMWTQSYKTGYEHLNFNSTQQCLRKICKNISVQNLRALEVEPGMGLGLKAASQHDTLMEDADPISIVSSIPTVMESHNDSSRPPLFCRGFFTDNNISFPEIFEYFFNEDDTETTQLDNKESRSPPRSPPSHGNSVPETYDYFFSDFETGNFFLPLIERDNCQNEPVPIFAHSRSSKRRLRLSTEYDFYPPDDSPVMSDDDDFETAPVRVVTHSDHSGFKTGKTATSVEIYEEFFEDNTWTEDLFWRNPFSLRRLCLPGLTDTKENPNTWSLRTTDCNEKSPPRTPKQQAHSHSSAHIYHLESWVFRQMTELQEQHVNLITTLTDPRRDSRFLALRQSDLCMICIAFASWVLRSASPQAGDTWKAALLANISALSAIRYLRRSIKNKAAQEGP